MSSTRQQSLDLVARVFTLLLTNTHFNNLGDAQIAAANAAAQVVQTDFQLATARAQLIWALGRA